MEKSESMIDVVTKNLKYLMVKNDIKNVAELSRLLKMNQPTVHRFLSGEVQEPKYLNLKQIADYFKISVQDLAETDLTKLTETPRYIHSLQIPIVGHAQLGDNGHWADMQYPIGYGDGYIRWPSDDDDAYALKCVGDSMMPRIKDGEYVVVEPNHTYSPGDEVLVVTNDDRAMVKTFLYSKNDMIHLISVNEAHPPIKIDKSEVAKIHYVAGIAKPSLRNE